MPLKPVVAAAAGETLIRDLVIVGVKKVDWELLKPGMEAAEAWEGSC